jgi:putative ABC transport system substrate-binding protein
MSGQYDRVPGLVADLVRRDVALIASPRLRAWRSRRQSCDRDDPDLVRGRGRSGQARPGCRPGGNVTGINFFVHEIVSKRLALVHEIVPKAARVAVLVNN